MKADPVPGICLWLKSDDNHDAVRISVERGTIVGSPYGHAQNWGGTSDFGTAELPPDAMELVEAVMAGTCPPEILVDRLIELGVPGAESLLTGMAT